MSSEAPALRTLADPELLTETTLVVGSLSAGGYLAGYATATGSTILGVASAVGLTGPLVGLKYLETKAQELEAGE